jgi:hypothetical protein
MPIRLPTQLGLDVMADGQQLEIEGDMLLIGFGPKGGSQRRGSIG